MSDRRCLTSQPSSELCAKGRAITQSFPNSDTNSAIWTSVAASAWITMGRAVISIVRRTIEITARPIVIQAEAATDVQIAELVSEFGKLCVIARPFAHSSLDG